MIDQGDALLGLTTAELSVTVGLTVSIVTAPPALPVAVAWAAPVVTRSPIKLTDPVPLTLISIAPEIAPVFGFAVVVIVFAAASVRPPVPTFRVTGS